MMKKLSILALAALMVGFVFAAPSFAMSNSGVMSMLGKPVLNEKGQDLGKIYDLVVNPKGQITWVILDKNDKLIPFNPFLLST